MKHFSIPGFYWPWRTSKLVWIALPMILSIALGTAPVVRLIERSYRSYRHAILHDEWSSERALRISSETPLQSGDCAGWLSIPTCGIESKVIYDPTKRNLANSPCLLRMDGTETAPKLIMAHRDTHFRGLRNLELGQSFTFERDNGPLNYQVRDIVILDTAELPATLNGIQGDKLVLLTCWPFNYIGPAPKRALFVSAPESANPHYQDDKH